MVIWEILFSKAGPLKNARDTSGYGDSEGPAGNSAGEFPSQDLRVAFLECKISRQGLSPAIPSYRLEGSGSLLTFKKSRAKRQSNILGMALRASPYCGLHLDRSRMNILARSHI